MKILNLVITLDRIKSEETRVVSFHIREGVESPEEALRGAVKDFLASGTPESKKALVYAGGCFNWGDAMSSIPNEYFKNRGLTIVETASIDISVDHDEILDNREINEEELEVSGISAGNKVFLKGGTIPLTPVQLAMEAGPGVSVSDYPARISGKHCDCVNGGEFELLPTDDPSVVSGGKRHMQCRICGGWSHL